MKHKISTILTVVVFASFGFLSLRSCVSVPTNINRDVYASMSYESGQVDYIWLTSANRILYYKTIGASEDVGLFEIRGEKHWSHLGPLYNLGYTPLGLRLYFGAKEVHDVELVLLASDYQHCGQTSFDQTGSRYDETYILYDDELSLGQTYVLSEPPASIKERMNDWYEQLTSKH